MAIDPVETRMQIFSFSKDFVDSNIKRCHTKFVHEQSLIILYRHEKV